MERDIGADAYHQTIAEEVHGYGCVDHPCTGRLGAADGIHGPLQQHVECTAKAQSGDNSPERRGTAHSGWQQFHGNDSEHNAGGGVQSTTEHRPGSGDKLTNGAPSEIANCGQS